MYKTPLAVLVGVFLAATIAATTPAAAQPIANPSGWGIVSLASRAVSAIGSWAKGGFRQSPQPNYGSAQGQTQRDLDEMLWNGEISVREHERLSAANGNSHMRVTTRAKGYTPGLR